MRPITPEGFEAMFRASIDPWNYRGSRFETVKRRALLRACGTRVLGRALELACAIGVTSRALAPRCLRLLAVDAAPTALAEARRLTPDARRIAFRHARLPRDMPRGPFALLVVSEIAYYLTPRDLDHLARAIRQALAPGGRVVVLHHIVPFADAAQPPAGAQSRLCRLLARSAPLRHTLRTARYEVRALQSRRSMR